jgi:phosphate/sulfate permease
LALACLPLELGEIALAWLLTMPASALRAMPLHTAIAALLQRGVA